MTLEEDKARLRREARIRRRQAHRVQASDASGHAVRHFLDWAAARQLGSGVVIAGYWPSGSEFDVRPLLERLEVSGSPIALPIEVPGRPLAFRRWHPGGTLEPGPHGIMQPNSAAEEIRPQVLLVPLLAFDGAGGRLGQGGGHYDRTLEALRQSGEVIAIGVAYASQRVDSVPRNGHDQRLDWVLTEEGIERTS